MPETQKPLGEPAEPFKEIQEEALKKVCGGQPETTPQEDEIRPKETKSWFGD